MENLLTALILVSLVSFLLSWLFPNPFIGLFRNKLSKGGVRAVLGISIVVFFVMFGITSDANNRSEQKTEQAKQEDQTSKSEETTEPENAEDKQQEKIADEIKGGGRSEGDPATEENQGIQENIPEFEIIYEIKDKRYDGGVSYYVLIDPVDPANDNFKDDTKAIIRKIVKDKGSKISIDLVDDKSVLDLEYKSHYGSNALGRILTKGEMDQLGLHLIATFSGELETGLYPNSLSFFPATFKDNPKVGKYVENMEFNP